MLQRQANSVVYSRAFSNVRALPLRAVYAGRRTSRSSTLWAEKTCSPATTRSLHRSVRASLCTAARLRQFKTAPRSIAIAERER